MNKPINTWLTNRIIVPIQQPHINLSVHGQTVIKFSKRQIKRIQGPSRLTDRCSFYRPHIKLSADLLMTNGAKNATQIMFHRLKHTAANRDVKSLKWQCPTQTNLFYPYSFIKRFARICRRQQNNSTK